MPETIPPGTSPVGQVRSAWITVGVAGLLAVYAALSLAASLHKGPSYDESEQLAVGYNVWINHDFRMEGGDGDLIKRWATLPYLFTQPRLPTTKNEYWRTGRTYIFGYEFFFHQGNLPDWLLLQGRAMAAVLGVLTGWLIFWCSRELFGAAGGLGSLMLFVFSPHMLAFGALVSTDMSACFVLLGATWSVWRVLHQVTWGRLMISLFFGSLLMLAKLSSLAIFPITLVLALIKLFSGLPLEWNLGRPRRFKSPASQAAVFAGLFLLHGLVAWAALWAHYDFRFAASPLPNDPTVTFTHYVANDPVDPRVAAFMDWLRDEHIVPEGFLEGVHMLVTSNDQREAFMDGQWYFGGKSEFFFHVLWDKTSPAMFLFAGLGLAGWWWARRRAGYPTGPVTGGLSRRAWPSCYSALPYFVLIAVYLLIAVIQDVDIGHRHILPIYPPLYILVGGSFACIWLQCRCGLRLVLGLLPVYLVAECVQLYPDYLTYFNPLVGGPAQGYRHLVDSSLDWGMDLPAVREWLDEMNPGHHVPVFLAYYGVDSPEYEGIKSLRLPSSPDWRIKGLYAYAPGFYVISATLYESDCMLPFGPWNTDSENHYQVALKNVRIFEVARRNPARLAALYKSKPISFWDEQYNWLDHLRFSRLCAWLRVHRPIPDARCANAILVWRLSQQEVTDAVLGPPPSIDDSILY
ncbi:MAG TPA: glycosyltransferase family 39 protein [Opitutales bacterium]|nr:glycosyltransferase family 39 protein [Opitutales bacterium]